MSVIVLDGSMCFGEAADPTTSYDGLSKAVVHLGVAKVANKPTYDNPRIYGRPGARQDTLELVYESDLNDAAGLFVLFMTALVAGTPVYWSGKYKNAAAGATNHRFNGSFYVTEQVVGASPGEAQEHSHTFDLITFGGPFTTDPT